jgi:serine phosphatase RsbU (regulator of sigma subunit)/DNA-binding NarL/FixJ family response regulator
MSESRPIRVMIVDDHSMVRKGLATILKVKPGLELVGEASNGQEALELCTQVQPDVVLMDLVMPEMDGAAATRAIRARWPQIQVIALTSFKETELVQGALEAGAISYLLKSISADELVSAIREAHAGRPTLAPEVGQVLSQAARMEQLARALIDAPPTASALPSLLQEHVPGMFPDSRIEIRLFPDQVLLRHPTEPSPDSHLFWPWIRNTSQSYCFLPSMQLPWGGTQLADEGLVVTPIVTVEGPTPIGGIYLSRRQDPGAVADLLPMVKSLAAQIASAVHSAQVHAQTLAHEKVTRELAIAGQIQASFLPTNLPHLPGWQLAVTLDPTSEASGDFYDFIPLANGHMGLVIADVSDKGMGAALFMALSRTLIRTYAAEYPTQPEVVLDATSRRMLEDTRAGLFVTVFYGILDPTSGTLTYCNAGHNPPCLLSPRNKAPVRELPKTGMALGVVEDTAWGRRSIQIEPGQALVLYTDGITEAQDQHETLFGRQRLLEFLGTMDVPSESRRPSAQHIQDALLAEVHRFMGQAPQLDDVTLVVLVRDS